MFSWISENLATVVTAMIFLAVVAVVIASRRRDKKKGKSSCGCGNCRGCVRNL